MKSNMAVFKAVAIAIAMTACASFKPQLTQQELLASRQANASDTKDGVTASVEEFASPDKSRKAFDANIAHYGVLAILVRVENKASQNYQLNRSNVTALLGGQPLAALQAEEASKSANNEYAGKALAWTAATGPFAIILWPGTIAGSASHTAYVNRRVKWHFQGIELKDTLIKPNETTSGFVYFALPDKPKKLEDLIVQLDAMGEQSGKISYKLAITAIDL